LFVSSALLTLYSAPVELASGLPAAFRVTVGASVWIAFVGYIVLRGRAAAAHGLTGALGEEPSTITAPARAVPAA